MPLAELLRALLGLGLLGAAPLAGPAALLGGFGLRLLVRLGLGLLLGSAASAAAIAGGGLLLLAVPIGPHILLQQGRQTGGAAHTALLLGGNVAQLLQLLLGGSHIVLGALALARAHHPNLGGTVGLGLLGGVLQPHLHLLPQEVDGGDVAHAVGALHKGLLLGAPLHGVLIGLLLVLQTAHQTAAGARNLGGIQGQVLGLGHLDGHRLELV